MKDPSLPELDDRRLLWLTVRQLISRQLPPLCGLHGEREFYIDRCCAAAFIITDAAWGQTTNLL